MSVHQPGRRKPLEAMIVAYSILGDVLAVRSQCLDPEFAAKAGPRGGIESSLLVPVNA